MNSIQRGRDPVIQEKIRLTYGSEPSQFGDLRIPNRGHGPFPVVVVIHGGFWYAQYGLDLMDAMADDFTLRGYATWNIEYRRVGQEGGGWPGTLMDVSSAVNFLRDIAPKYNLDLTRVITVGHSAGGHLALWSAARHRLPEGSAVSPTRINPVAIHGVVSLAGVTDVRQMWEVRQVDSPCVDFLGGTPSEYPDRYDAASPRELLPLGVPQVLVHGDKDDRVPIALSESYYDAAMEIGDTIAMIELPGIEHFKVIHPDSEAWPPIADAVDELIANLAAL